MSSILFHNGIIIKNESVLNLIEPSAQRIKMKIRCVSKAMERVNGGDQISKAQLFNLEFVWPI